MAYVALAMNPPMQVSSSNSLISLAMTSSPGTAPAKPQLEAGTLVPRDMRTYTGDVDPCTDTRPPTGEARDGGARQSCRGR